MAEDMEQAVETVRDAYEAFNRGDFDASSAYIHPDIVWNRVAEVEVPLEGREAVRANMEPEIFAEQQSEILETIVEGDCVLARAAFHAKGAGSGIEMTDTAWHLWRMKDGMAIEFSYFNTRDEAVAAARS